MTSARSMSRLAPATSPPLKSAAARPLYACAICGSAAITLFHNEMLSCQTRERSNVKTPRIAAMMAMRGHAFGFVMNAIATAMPIDGMYVKRSAARVSLHETNGSTTAIVDAKKSIANPLMRDANAMITTAMAAGTDHQEIRCG